MTERQRKLAGTRRNPVRNRGLRRHSAIVPRTALWWRVAGIERTSEIARQREADQHSEPRGQRHGEQEADETEQITERKQREHQPDRMQADAFADKFGRQDIAFEKLAEQNDAGDDHDAGPVRSKLRQSDSEREDQRGQRADIENETDQARYHADQHAET